MDGKDRAQDKEPSAMVLKRYEIAASALQSMAGFDDVQTRAFARATLSRLLDPDKATLFEDYRERIRRVEDRASELRTVLGRLVGLVGQKRMMDAILAVDSRERILSLEEIAVLEMTVIEAKRCLEEDE